MEKLCFGTLVQLVRKADPMLKKRAMVEMFLGLVLDYSYPPIKGQRGDDFVVTDKIASNLVNRKSNLPENIVQAARADEGVISSAQEHVEKNIRKKLSPASLPAIIGSIIAVVRDDPSIPSEKRQEFISSGNAALADEEVFSHFFSGILLYVLQVNNNRLGHDDAEGESRKPSASIDSSEEKHRGSKFDKIEFESLDIKHQFPSFRGRIHRKIPFWTISSAKSCAKRDFRRKPGIACRPRKRLVPDFCEIVENRNFSWINRRKSPLKV